MTTSRGSSPVNDPSPDHIDVGGLPASVHLHSYCGVTLLIQTDNHALNRTVSRHRLPTAST
ncbi:hypothetical protein ACNUDN_05055 [Mycobacterium sp. smrl_JER01]